MNFVIGILALFILMSCGNYEEFKESASSFGSFTPVSGLDFSDIRKNVLDVSCLQCHRNYERYDAVVKDLEKIMVSVRSDRMPKDRTPLSVEQKTLLFSWAAAGAPRGSAPGDNPGDGGALPLAPTWASVSQNILFAKCVVCHSANGQVPFPSFETRNEMFAVRDQFFDFDDPEDSYFLEVIEDPIDPMPPPDSGFEKLSKAEIEVLKEWIRLGLP